KSHASWKLFGAGWLSRMKVGTIDPRAHEVHFGDGLLRQVPQATQAAAARRLAAATARSQANTFVRPAPAKCASRLPPRPIPVTPYYRSCFQSPQATASQEDLEVPRQVQSPYQPQDSPVPPAWSRVLEPRAGPSRSPPRSPEAAQTASANANNFVPRSCQAPAAAPAPRDRPERASSDERQEDRCYGSPARTFARDEYRTPTRAPSRGDRGSEARSNAQVRTRSIDMARNAAFSGCHSDRLALKQRGAAVQRPVETDDCAEYSDRFLPGYEKSHLLGRGACAVVWLATPMGSRTPVAIKQVAKGTTGKKKSDTEAARKEILFGSYFFNTGGEPKMSVKKSPGIAHIAKLLDFVETKRDIWLVMEFGGTSLTKMA
ncbi:unnamed protein product, partial [Effrenium voratum]